MKRPLNIGVDATTWQNKRGYGRFMRSLLKALFELDNENVYTLFFDTNEGLSDLPNGIEIRIIEAKNPTNQAASAKGARSLGDIIQMSRALSDPEFDLLLFPTVYSYVPVFSRARKIITIHDVIADLYPRLTFPNWRSRLFWKIKVKVGCMQADIIVTISDYSKKGITELLDVHHKKIKVVNEAPDPIFRYIKDFRTINTLNGYEIPVSCRIILYIGGFGPHKNLRFLVDAFRSISGKNGFSDCVLVLVGEFQNETFFSEINELMLHINNAGIRDKVVFTGFLPDEELVLLMNQSEVLVLPSLIEGLGLPALEAAACGCPVIATKESPLPDLLGKGGIFIDPYNLADLEQAMITVLSSPEVRHEMGMAGVEAVDHLSWQKSARRMLEIICEAAGI